MLCLGAKDFQCRFKMNTTNSSDAIYNESDAFYFTKRFANTLVPRVIKSNKNNCFLLFLIILLFF